MSVSVSHHAGGRSYRQLYPQYFALLPDELAQAIDFVITKNVQWGWEPEPSAEDVRDLCLVAARRLTTEEQLNRATSRR